MGLQNNIRSQIRPHNPKDLLTAMEVVRDVEEASKNPRTSIGSTNKSNHLWGKYQGVTGTKGRQGQLLNLILSGGYKDNCKV